MMQRLAWITEHWQLKLLSLAFATALWAFAASEDRIEMVYTVPVDFVEVPTGLAVTPLEDETVEVRVRGLRGVLARVREQDLRAPISLRDTPPGEFVARILPRDVEAPRGVQIVRVTPSRVRATLHEAAPPESK